MLLYLSFNLLFAVHVGDERQVMAVDIATLCHHGPAVHFPRQRHHRSPYDTSHHQVRFIHVQIYNKD